VLYKFVKAGHKSKTMGYNFFMAKVHFFPMINRHTKIYIQPNAEAIVIENGKEQ
jgi:hypothetical protein